MRIIDRIIYLDTKISGAIYQTIKYFDLGIFDKKKVKIVWKYYPKFKKGTLHKFGKLFDKAGINHYPFKKYSQIPSLDGATVFYLFNAQSNCRIVANRKAKHIFVSHGESHKLSSAKPITRIYDHVVVAGDVGIDRFVESGIFTKCDLKNNKIIKMGNTFIGDSGYTFDTSSDTIVYAPTWEGGIAEENYCSIDKTLHSFSVILDFMQKHHKDKIIIQPHPNLGHRDKRYLYYLLSGIKLLYKGNINIYMTNWESTLYHRTFGLFIKSFISGYADNKQVSHAFCDISAMEVQLLDKDIPTFVFLNDREKRMPSSSLIGSHYKKVGITKEDQEIEIDLSLQKKIKDYYIGYESKQLLETPLSGRVDWLSDFAWGHQNG